MMRSPAASPNLQGAQHLVKYEAACRALAEARSVDEIKEILIVAEAMKAAARVAKNRDLYADAFELSHRGERRLREKMVAQVEAFGPAKPGPRRQIGSADDPISLAEAGIDKHLAHRARLAGAMSDVEFETFIAEGRHQIIAQADRILRRVINANDRAKTKAKAVAVPDGRYGCIVIDPPWPMEKIERDVRPNQVGFGYPTMTEEELSDFDLPAFGAENCHLFCWTTHRFLPVALRLVDGWGFRYVLTMVWHKPGGFQPVGLPQYNCEFIVYARQGTPRFIETKDFNCCFEAARREHGRKPSEFYDTVRRVTTEPRIDVFSREPYEGFAQHGNEIDKFAEVAE